MQLGIPQKSRILPNIFYALYHASVLDYVIASTSVSYLVEGTPKLER